MMDSNTKPFLAQVLDERQLDTGIVYYGDMARVRSFMHKLRNQQPVHMGEDHTNGQPTTQRLRRHHHIYMLVRFSTTILSCATRKASG